MKQLLFYDKYFLLVRDISILVECLGKKLLPKKKFITATFLLYCIYRNKIVGSFCTITPIYTLVEDLLYY